MNTVPNKNQITLVGAGLVGSLLSLYLANRGYEVEVLERRGDMRTTDIGRGRSINLAISTRGLHALSEVGLSEDVLKLALPMCGRLMHSTKGEMVFQRYGVHDRECIYSISRADLNKLLMTRAEQTGQVKIQFNQKVMGVDFEKKTLDIELAEGEKIKKAFNVVIGTDGSASQLRNDLATLKNSPAQEIPLTHGYKELTIPAALDKTHVLANNALHIWPRSDFMLIALPNLDGSFTATLFLPHEGPISFAAIKTKEDVNALFVEYFNDVFPHMPGLTEEYFENPTGKMITIKSSPWHHKDDLLILGDAAHAIVPFFGQGMNCGFEDCSVLDKILGQKGFQWQLAFEEFYKRRKPNSDAIADMAAENFVEMRDKVGQTAFLIQKEVESILQDKFPENYSSRYRNVTFSRIPYRLAYDAGVIQSEILDELCRGLKRPQDVDLDKAAELIESKLAPILKDQEQWS